MKKKLIIVALLCALGAMALALCCCKVKKTDNVYTVKYYVGGELYSEENLNYGDNLQLLHFDDNEDDDSYFVGWCTSQSYTDWYTASVITSDLSLYGYWGNYEDSHVTVSYCNKSEVVEEVKYKKGSLIENIDLPDTDDGYSFNEWLIGDTPFDFDTKISADLQLNSSWVPTEFTVEFLSLGESIAKFTYTVEDNIIEEPDCPDREHYESGGYWEDYELTVGNKQVNAVYTPIVYTVQYFDYNNEVVSTIDYTVLTYKEIAVPTAPVVSGCICYWDELECGVTSLSLKVTLLDYKIDYVIEGELIDTFEHTILTYNKLVEPDIPEKTGYNCYWEKYLLREETHITVNAVYDPITYYVSFVADGKTVGTSEYTIEEHDIELPDIPIKNGYTGVWEDFELTYGDLLVNAEYSTVEYYAHFTVFDELTDYSERLTYTSSFNIENFSITNPSQSDYRLLAGCSVKWDEPDFGLHDIEIYGYYYDSDYTYLDFRQVKIYEDTNIIDRYFYVAGLSCCAADIFIPSTYHAYPVKFIEKEAFVKADIKSVVIDGVEEIRSGAFKSCVNLESLSVNDGVAIIGEMAFYNCSLLTDLVVSDTVTDIQPFAFAQCGITTLSVPRGISVLSENVFDSCLNLEKVIMYDNIIEIGYGAFIGCCSLSECIIGENVVTIKTLAFSQCSSLHEITIPEKVMLIENDAFTTNGDLYAMHLADQQSTWYFVSSSENMELPTSIKKDGYSIAACLQEFKPCCLIKKAN